MLMNISAKVLSRIIEERIKALLEDTQTGFRKVMSAQVAIFISKQIIGRIIGKNKDVHICLIDLDKIFDKIRGTQVWNSLKQKR